MEIDAVGEAAERTCYEPENIGEFIGAEPLVRRTAAAAGIKPEHIDLIVRGGAELRKDGRRLADLTRCAQTLADNRAWNYADWQDTPRDRSPAEAFFLLFPLLQRLNSLRHIYRQRGIGEDVWRATMSDFQRWIEGFAAWHGYVGFQQIHWLRYHVLGEVFALGRLQFQPTLLQMPYQVWRQKRGEQVCVVATAGRITREGIFADSEGAAGATCEPVYEAVAGEVRCAHRVNSAGFIEFEPTAFRPGEWRLALAPGDATLAIHIPAGAPLDCTACCEALERAVPFFRHHFPELPPVRAFTCGSWLLNPDLPKLLAPHTNIVRFQKLFMLVPLPGASAYQTYERVFGVHGRVLDMARCVTSLQRVMAAYVGEGRVPLSGGGIIMAQ